MISAKNPAVSDDIIYWTKENATCKVVTIDDEADIVEYLEKAEDNYQDNGERTLLHIKNFDSLINPELSSEETIASMKSIMGACARRYHTTILFSSQNPEKLDEIAMGPHRVKRIYVNAEKSVTDIWRNIAAKQVKEKTPVSDYERVRNVLYLAGLDKAEGFHITSDATAEEISRIKARFIDFSVEKSLEIFANAGIKAERKVEPTNIYYLSGGTIQKFPAYRHNFEVSLPEGAFLKDSVISLSGDEHSANIFPVLYKNICGGERYPYRFFTWSKIQETNRKVPNEFGEIHYPDSHTELFPHLAEHSYNRIRDKFKSGIKAIDNYFSSIELAPSSLRTYFSPADYETLVTTYYKPQDRIYNNDLLHSVGKEGLYYNVPKAKMEPYRTSYVLNLLSREQLEMLEMLWSLVDYMTPEYESPSSEISPDRQKELLDVKKQIIFSDTEKSVEELRREFAKLNLQDRKRNIEQPVEALRYLLLATGLNKDYSLSIDPSDEEMSLVMRGVRDYVLNLAKEDLKNMTPNYVSYYQNLNSYIDKYDYEYDGIHALILIADEHLTSKCGYQRGKLFSLRAQEPELKNAFKCVNKNDLERLAQKMEHYEDIKLYTEVLPTIHS